MSHINLRLDSIADVSDSSITISVTLSSSVMKEENAVVCLNSKDAAYMIDALDFSAECLVSLFDMLLSYLEKKSQNPFHVAEFSTHIPEIKND